VEYFSTLLDAAWSEPSTRAAIVSFTLTVAAGAIKWLLTPSSKVLWAVSHQHAFSPRNAQGNEILLRTREIWIQNAGRAVATNVQVALNHDVQHIETWPPVPYEIIRLNDGRPVFSFNSLVRNEVVTISMLSDNDELPAVLYVKWDGGRAKFINMGPQRIYGSAFSVLVFLLLLVGAFSSVYLFVRLIQLIAGS
jgi:hypothetical protein